MSLDQVIRESVLKLTVSSKDGEKNLASFKKATDATAKSLDAVSVQSLDAQKAIETIGLGAERQVPRLEKLHSSFQGFTGKIGKGLNAIDSFGKALGPWNQALELGGKALDGVVAGLDAYAKTSPEAAREVQALKDEFGHLKDSVLAATGAMTVEMAKAIPVAEELKKKYIEISNTEFFKKFGLRSSGGVLTGGFLGDFLSGDDETGGSFDKDKFRDFRDTIVPGYLEALDKINRKNIALAESQKKAAIEAARWRAELAALASKGAKESTDELVAYLEPQFAGGPSKITDKQLQLQMGIDVGKSLSGLGRDREEKGPTFLERLGLDDPSALNLALTAVQGLTSGMQAAFQALGEGTLSGADAFKKGLGIMVHAIGDKLAAMAAAEAVEGAAMLLTFNPMGGLHLAAAGLLGAGAVAAYAASSRLGGGSGSVASVPGASSGTATSTYTGATGRGGGASSQSAPSSGGGPVVNQFIGYIDEDSPRLRQRRAERLVNLGTQHTSAGGSF